MKDEDDKRPEDEPAPEPKVEAPKKARLRDKLAKLLDEDVNIYPIF